MSKSKKAKARRRSSADVKGQKKLFGTLDKKQKAVLSAAKDYRAKAERRMEATRRARSPEIDAQKKLLAAMAAIGKDTFVADGIEVIVKHGVDKVAVKDAKGQIEETIEVNAASA